MRLITRLVVIFALCFFIGFALTKAVADFYSMRNAELEPLPAVGFERVEVPQVFPPPTAIEPAEYITNLSPYQIKAYIDAYPTARLKWIWERLKLESFAGEKGDDDSNDLDYLGECVECKAVIYRFSARTDSVQRVILKVSDETMCPRTRYMVFERTAANNQSTGWRLIGNLTSRYCHWIEPSERILHKGPEPWLLITREGVTGSGVSSSYNSLYTVIDGKFSDILHFASDGWQFGFPEERPSRAFQGRILNCSLVEGKAKVELEYSVKYSTSRHIFNDLVLWSKTQRAVFVKVGNADSHLVENLSRLTTHEVESVYEVDSLSDEELLQYNYADLLIIARGKDQVKREWLRKYLRTAPRTPENTNLQTALGR